jgi:hypothetical protein
LIQDGRNDFRKFHEQIQNANITFTMTNVITGVIKIGKSPAKIQQVLPKSDCINDEFYLTYQFSETQTQFQLDILVVLKLRFLMVVGNL